MRNKVLTVSRTGLITGDPDEARIEGVDRQGNTHTFVAFGQQARRIISFVTAGHDYNFDYYPAVNEDYDGEIVGVNVV